jgi:hypothetical protein
MDDLGSTLALPPANAAVGFLAPALILWAAVLPAVASAPAPAHAAVVAGSTAFLGSVTTAPEDAVDDSVVAVAANPIVAVVVTAAASASPAEAGPPLGAEFMLFNLGNPSTCLPHFLASICYALATLLIGRMLAAPGMAAET